MKVTIYRSGMFGVNKIEARLHDVGTRKWAQYDNAVSVKYTRKRKRKAEEFIVGYRPYVYIVKGWDRPDPADPMGATSVTSGGFLTSKTRHPSFSPEYLREFDEMVENNDMGEVVFDHRWTQREGA